MSVHFGVEAELPRVRWRQRSLKESLRLQDVRRRLSSDIWRWRSRRNVLDVVARGRGWRDWETMHDKWLGMAVFK